MPPDVREKPNFFFRDPRLGMTVLGRFFVRASSLVAYLVLVGAAFSLLAIADLRWMRWAGILLAFFLVDRAIHARRSERPLSGLAPNRPANLARYLSPRAFSAIEQAFDRSAVTGKNFFLELALRLSGRGEAEDALRRLDVPPAEFKQKIEDFLKEETEPRQQKENRLRDAGTAVACAAEQAIENSRDDIGLADLLAALPGVGDETINRLFGMFSLEARDIEQAALFSAMVRRFSVVRNMPAALGGFMLDAHRGARHRIMNRAWTSRPTPTLDAHSIDFTDLARREEIGFLIGHEAEYNRLTDALSRSSNPNALLVGEAGVGKETLIAHLAFRITKDKVPPPLFDKRLVALEITSLVAGAEPNELDRRLKAIVGEITTAGNIILFVPDIHNLMKTSGAAYLSAADALLPIIANNAFPVVGTTYPREFKEFLERRSDFTSLFEVIRVDELGEDDARRVLVYQGIILERRGRIMISMGAIKKAVAVAKKYFRDKPLPSSAVELLKNALVEAERRGGKSIGADEVVTTAEARVNVPLHEAGEAEASALLNLEATIHERLIGQDEAVRVVANSLREYRSGLTRRGGPIASFLFVGPTGVGKTELAKTLARIQFGSENLMIRFDMTEYQDKQSFFRFIGSPDGKTSGSLTDAVMQKPYSVVLLDEFEKAFPDILNLFLQVLDDGRLTDNLGRTVDFTNTLIIATSNAHSDIINDALREGKSMTQIADYLKSRLTDVFKPELLNRFSSVVVFRNLEPRELSEVAEINLKDLASVAAEQGITLAFDSSAVREVARLGYDPAFGARPLRRAIEEHLRAPLASKILAKEIKKGDRVMIALENGLFQFRVTP